MISSQQHLHKILSQPRKNSAQIVKQITNGGYDLPDCLFEHAYISYKQNPNSDEKYNQMQAIIHSSLQMKMPINVARKYFKSLRKQIGDNPYINRLMKFINYIHSPQMTQQISLGQIISQDLSDNQTRKKVLTSYKRKNKIGQFIEHLNRYLENQPMDEQAWVELAELYCERANYMKAAFCYQELVILNPSNDNFTLRLAQIYLTENNKGNIIKSIQYLSYLISKRPDNIRALWILYRACCCTKGQQYTQLKEISLNSINKLYSQRNSAIKIHEVL